VSLLANAGRIRRKGTSSLRLFERREIEAFGRKYIFVAEIQERAAIPRARDVRTWLGARGVRIAFELAQDRYLAFDRSRVERVLAEEAQHALQAAK